MYYSCTCTLLPLILWWGVKSLEFRERSHRSLMTLLLSRAGGICDVASYFAVTGVDESEMSKSLLLYSQTPQQPLFETTLTVPSKPSDSSELAKLFICYVSCNKHCAEH